MKYAVLILSLFMVACADPVQQCVEKKQDSWRKSNPNADYAKASSVNEKFREECKRQLK